MSKNLDFFQILLTNNYLELHISIFLSIRANIYDVEQRHSRKEKKVKAVRRPESTPPIGYHNHS